jgi:type I restriction enzyme S subunit
VTELLGNLCRFVTGGTPSKSEARFFDGHIPWITSADITEAVASTARSFITDEAVSASATNRVAAGTVLLVTRTGVGKVAVAGCDLCFSQDITALIPDSARLDTAYLVHFLRTKEALIYPGRTRWSKAPGTAKLLA